ncbi:MAG: DUF1570 domain-containing protein [Planctomycetes bacterium]|nr:DUF1570 domain-containing protein [Planctomycetota bacterium]
MTLFQKYTRREKLLLVVVAVGAALLLLDTARRRWSPVCRVDTAHYALESSAPEPQARRMGDALEVLYRTYAEFFKDTLELRKDHARLRVRLYRDRAEFKRCNPGSGWAEAFYDGQLCHAYFAADDANPHHWTLHEATHQLDAEVAGLALPRWLEEGLATYFSTSRLVAKDLPPELGRVDLGTYPVWWLHSFQLSGDPDADRRSGQILSLETVVLDTGGADVDQRFNLYYLHAWSLTHFLFHGEDGKYAKPYLALLRAGFSKERFEQTIAPLPTLEREWYGYLREDLLAKVWQGRQGAVRPVR